MQTHLRHGCRPSFKRPAKPNLPERSLGEVRWQTKVIGRFPTARRNMLVVDRRLDVDRDGWPEGSGNVERPGMGQEKLDNGVYYMRGLYDLADMARSKHDTATAQWATRLANKLQRQFEATWWDPGVAQYADSLKDPGNVQVFQKHWIGQVPMEAELTFGTTAVPGVARADHARTALAARQTPCYSGVRPGNRGLFHTGCGGGADGKGDFEIFSLTTSIQAIGEGNYGRLGPGQQRRYTDANAETMFSEPATGGTPDEQPGAMPEIFPSTPQGNASAGVPPNIDRCWTCRSSFMQAWGGCPRPRRTLSGGPPASSAPVGSVRGVKKSARTGGNRHEEGIRPAGRHAGDGVGVAAPCGDSGSARRARWRCAGRTARLERGARADGRSSTDGS
jgi:hypothetical protein